MMAGAMRALPRRLRPLLLFVPSVVLGLLGGVWLTFRPLRLEAAAGVPTVLLAAAALLVTLLGSGWLLERSLPSFRHAGRLLERALQGLRLNLPLSLGLALTTAFAEELFFRGALLGLIGVWPQALLFGLLHPATRRGWSYTAFTFVAGLAFGYATVWTGSLWAAILAHFVINLQGFLEIRSRQRRWRRRFGHPPVPAAAAAATAPSRQAERSPPDTAPSLAPAAPPNPHDGSVPPPAGDDATSMPETAADEAEAASPGTPGSAAPPLREPPAL
jgi:membrane protease YdiL (CAAX protease family)